MRPVFEDRFETVLEYPYDERYLEMVDWIDKNSKGTVSIQLLPTYEQILQSKYVLKKKVYVGFENTDDAIFFKIKYSV